MNDVVSEVKKRLDIVEFITPYTQLKKTGANFKGLCPFHKEKTPSFVVSPERQIWRCFGSCNEGGDVISFLIKLENLTFSEALEELAQKAGVKIDRSNFDDKTWKRKERFIQMNRLAAEYFAYVLFEKDIGKKALEYLKKRGIKTQIIKKFQLGYAPSSWDSLVNFLTKKQFTPAELAEGGLAIRSERGGYYDRFRGRLMFPIRDSRGVTIGFSGRILDESEKIAKYINSPETPLYRKRETLFGIDHAKEAIKTKKIAYLVEGEFDMIGPYQAGFENFVATKGTAITREQLTLLSRFTDRVNLALDADEAGEEAVKKTVQAAEPLELEIGVIELDYAKDPDEAVRTDPIKFKKLLSKQTPIYEYLIGQIRKKYPDNDSYSKRKIGDEMIPFVERIQNPIVQSHYVKKIADILDVSEQSVIYMLRKVHSQKQRSQVFGKQQAVTSQGRDITIQKYLMSVLFQSKDTSPLCTHVFSIITPEDLSIPSLSKLARHLIEYMKGKKSFDYDAFVHTLPPELAEALDEIYLFASIELGLQNSAIDKLAYEIKKYSLKRQLAGSLGPDDDESLEQNSSLELKKLGESLKEVEKKLTEV